MDEQQAELYQLINNYFQRIAILKTLKPTTEPQEERMTASYEMEKVHR